MAISLLPTHEPPSDVASRAEVVAALAGQLRDLEGERFASWAGETLSTGLMPLDRLLPGGGLRRGTLVEWLGETAEGGSGEDRVAGGGRVRGGNTAASGAGTLALIAARSALQTGGALVVLDRARRFYPPAALAWGIPFERLIVVRPASKADEAWAVDQSLRSRGVAAVWIPLETADEHTLRRWQLAAENSGTLGLLVRGPDARSEPSWADLRLGVEPLLKDTPERARRLRVELLRARSGAAGRTVEVELTGREAAQEPGGWREASHETDALHLASSMASATYRRSRRA